MSPLHFDLAGAGPRRLGMIACAAALSLVTTATEARPGTNDRLGHGLREFVELHRSLAPLPVAAQRAELARTPSRASWAVLDTLGRVRVDVHLNGQQRLAQVQRRLARFGATTVAHTERWRHGVITAFVPPAHAAELSRAAGVKSVLLSPDPVTDVGVVTTEGAVTVKADRVNTLGIRGAGVTVGVLSDSYDVSTVTAVRAARDIASGDLPGPGNPDGRTNPVVVIEEGAAGHDEGRAMLQIVHDLAPAAKLCFATALNGQVGFADNIRRLADKSGPCGADVLVDDVLYLAEPMFSDGLVAQAVDEVAAQGVSYFSSAGNRGATQGYLANFRGVSYEAAVAASPTVDLSLIGAAAAAGGLHDHAAGEQLDIARTVQLGSGVNTLVFQWDDPFDGQGVSTDYDLYLYDSTGTILVASSVDNNLVTDQPVEAVRVGQGVYQVVIARAHGGTTEPRARVLRFVTFGTVVNGEYLDYGTPTTYGHNSAAGAMSTAAVPWFQPDLPESFTSPGPALVAFDAAGRRLPRPEVRHKPDFAAPDGVNTTFFSSDTIEDADGLPNFFGTSAAAPHAAAVAALALEAAGGPGRVSPPQMRRVLQATAGAHDLAPGRSGAVAQAGPARVVVRARGDGTSFSQFDPHALEVRLIGPAGWSLDELTLDLSAANAQRLFLGEPAPGMQFDPRVGAGQPLTLGRIENLLRTDVSFSTLSAVAPFSQSLTVNFTPGAFTRDSRLQFGVDRDETATGGAGNSVDLLIGSTVRGAVRGPGGEPVPFFATFERRRFQKGWAELDGWGLIDALAATQAVAPTRP